MPVLYGEGHKAFIRLQEEIVRTSTDQSIFAWEGDHEVPILSGDLVFASDPSQFSHGGKIVPWRTSHITRPYQLTNRGITFEALLFRQGREDCFGFLNCRYEDNLVGPIVLRLCQFVGNNKSQILALAEDYWVKPLSLSAPAKRPRTTVVTLDAGDTTKAINLLRHDPSLSAERDFIVPPKVRLCHSSQSSLRFSIIAAEPRDQWNVTTRIMCPPAAYSRQRHFGHVRLRDPAGREFKMLFFISEGYDMPMSKNGTQFDPNEGDTREFRIHMLEAQSDFPAASMHIESHSAFLTKEAILRFDAEDLYARAKQVSSMGDIVYVVEIGHKRRGLSRLFYS